MSNRSRAPAPPDPTRVAEAQTASNRATAITQAQLNQVNQQTPFGSLEFRQIGTFDDGTPRFEAVTSLSPEVQGIASGGLSRLGELAGGGNLDFSDPAIGGEIEARFLPRLERDIARGRESLEARLANQGINIGSRAFSDAFRDFGETETDARTRLAIDARAQAIGELLGARNQNLREIGASLGIQPEFQPTPQTGVQPTDVAGIQQRDFQNRQLQFNTEQQRRAASLGAIAGLGGQVAGWALSDRRAKTDIKHVGELHDGQKVYSYKYKGAGGLTQLGVMAQEVEKTNPDAVAELDSGIKVVNYDAVTEHANAAA